MWFDQMSGVQLRKNNAKKIAEWVRGEYHFVKENGADIVFVVANTSRGDVMIREGDWIAKDVDECFRIVRIEEMDIDKVLVRSKSKKNVLQVSAKKYTPPTV